MAYVNVPKDLANVKNKVIFNLTLRQILGIGISAALGIIAYLLLYRLIGTTFALLVTIIVAGPGMMFGLYERNGMHFEQVLRNMLNVIWLRPKQRRYETVNVYHYASTSNKSNGQQAQKKKTSSSSSLPNMLRPNRNKKDKAGKKPNPLLHMHKENEISVQDSIPYKEMARNGICLVKDNLYSKTVRFSDITYQLAQEEDKALIFGSWCEFLNYFDDTVAVQISFVNHHSGIEEYERAVIIPPQGDAYDAERVEYSRILQDQLTKGNNGLVKTKYITFSIKAKNYKEAKQRLERIETDIINNFKILGVQAEPVSGEERLQIMYETFNPEGAPFNFNFNDMFKSGLSTKDYIAPASFEFNTGRTFRMGDKWASCSFLQILASELSDKMLAELLETENEVIINLHIHSIEQQRAIKIVKQKLTDINRMKIDEQKKALRNGYDMEIIPTDLNTYANEAQNMLESLQSRDERMFMVTIVFLNTGDTREKLELAVQQINGIASKHNCNILNLDFMQEEGLAASLPLGYNPVPIERGLTTGSTAVFVPFTTQELFMKGESVYYGLNAISNNMILANRKELKNPNGLILGTPGAGKSFTAKREILNVFFVTHDDIIICDPESEYGPLVDTLGGQIIHISSTSKDYINPMDINMDYSDEDDPLSVKTDSILSMYELMVGKEGVDPVEKSILNRCIRATYQPYFDDPRPENMPILGDLYNNLKEQEEEAAKHIADVMELYVNGSLNIFNHHTNVELNNRVVCFDTKDLGKQLKKLGMLIVQDQVWNRVTQNRGTDKFTWYYIDEFHLLLREEQTAAYSGEIWKRFRKWGGIPTGITQNVKDLLQSSEIENIFENSDFVVMLNQRGEDREILAQHLNISPNQLSYVTNSNAGEGLIFYGSIIIPFRDRFDKKSPLYKLMSTKPKEMVSLVESNKHNNNDDDDDNDDDDEYIYVNSEDEEEKEED